MKITVEDIRKADHVRVVSCTNPECPDYRIPYLVLYDAQGKAFAQFIISHVNLGRIS